VFCALGGQQVIEDLQISPYHEVYKLSAEILERFFGAQEMEGEEKMQFITNNKFSI
jgi:hypothetical protein